ncbi:hypothetical protein ABZ479_16890 [Streptomyces sp. NPDC005722]
MTARPQGQDEAVRELLRTAAPRMKEQVGEVSERGMARLHAEVPGFVDHADHPDCSLDGFARMITTHLDRLADPERAVSPGVVDTAGGPVGTTDGNAAGGQKRPERAHGGAR